MDREARLAAGRDALRSLTEEECEVVRQALAAEWTRLSIAGQRVTPEQAWMAGTVTRSGAVTSADSEVICGETVDHDEFITEDGPDGIYWRCLRCDAEGFEESMEDDSKS